MGTQEDVQGALGLTTGSQIGKPRMHTEECRARIMEQVGQTDKGKELIDKANDRMNQWTADQNPDANVTVQNAQEGRKDDAMEGDRPVVIADPAIETSTKIVEPTTDWRPN